MGDLSRLWDLWLTLTFALSASGQALHDYTGYNFTAVVGQNATIQCGTHDQHGNTVASDGGAEVLSIIWGHGAPPETIEQAFIIQKVYMQNPVASYQYRGDFFEERFGVGPSHELIIRNTKKIDEGNYWCQVALRYKGTIEHTAMLKVQEEEKPSPTASSKPAQPVLGNQPSAAVISVQNPVVTLTGLLLAAYLTQSSSVPSGA